MILSTDISFYAEEGRGTCPVGSQGEFSTFGFLSFATTMLSTIVNMGKCNFKSILKLKMKLF